jgi:hypothetical protein
MNPPWAGPRSTRRTRNRSFRHAHIEIDLIPKPEARTASPLWARLERFLAEKKVEESADLVWLTAETLHALASHEFRRVDHWEVTPGGWLPPPEFASTDLNDAEPVGQLLKAIGSGVGPSIAKARSFSVRISDMHGNRADIVVRRVHRLRRHTLSLDLWGSWTKGRISELTGALAARLPVARSTLTKFQYAPG